MILLTTSRRPTKAMRTFCHELKRAIPNIIRINRGKTSFDELAEKAMELHANRVIIVDRWHGGVGKIQFFNVDTSGLTLTYPTIQVAKVKLQREFGEKRMKPNKTLAISKTSQNFAKGNILAQSLSKFLGVPILSVEDAIANGYHAIMQISRDTSNQLQMTFLKLPAVRETGPRIIIKQLT